MTVCYVCMDQRYERFAGGEDRPCHACNADFYEREAAHMKAAVVTPERLEQEAAELENREALAAGWIRQAAKRIAELEAQLGTNRRMIRLLGGTPP